MNELLKQLHDIEGVGHVSPWPLAIGWWFFIALGTLLLGLSIWFAVRKIAFMRSWKSDTLQKLAALDRNLSDATARETAMVLSEYLRRIALRRFSRKECAGLCGESWLKWLAEKDPKQFNWEQRGKVLIAAPYAPVAHRMPANQVKDLIQAAREWVC